MPGIGQILALTIMIETGETQRFPRVGDYASYCRRTTGNVEIDVTLFKYAVK